MSNSGDDRVYFDDLPIGAWFRFQPDLGLHRKTADGEYVDESGALYVGREGLVYAGVPEKKVSDPPDVSCRTGDQIVYVLIGEDDEILFATFDKGVADRLWETASRGIAPPVCRKIIVNMEDARVEAMRKLNYLDQLVLGFKGVDQENTVREPS